jgi:hypothetical protein
MPGGRNFLVIDLRSLEVLKNLREGAIGGMLLVVKRCDGAAPAQDTPMMDWVAWRS